jgi:hypothetical protein
MEEVIFQDGRTLMEERVEWGILQEEEIVIVL